MRSTECPSSCCMQLKQLPLWANLYKNSKFLAEWERLCPHFAPITVKFGIRQRTADLLPVPNVVKNFDFFGSYKRTLLHR